ncbi:MAG: SUMF1/EgtB/PvdO family nonheme iron enzyme [bacterium]|nr:SUMF1/EgtB/PvdO family nonheme iron enzyme [bacterium]
MADVDGQLERFLPEFSRKINITSDPPGATVSIKYYGDPESEWIPLGVTPLQEVRYPRGFTRLKLELAGHRPCHDLLWIIENSVFGATDNRTSLWHYRLVSPGEIPDDMELIPGGEFPLFMPGLDHLKTEPMSEFLLDRHPVTNREFKKFVDIGGYDSEEYWRHPFVDDGRTIERQEALGRFTDAVGQPGPAGWEFGEFPSGEDDLPVTGISWYEAAAYAVWAGKELPTIFHWNRVAFTVASSQIIPFCNFSGKSLLPVGSTQAMHRFGIYDLAGNVREWTWNECNRPGQRFILGGGWNDAEYAITDAYAQSPFDRSRTNGFRCMRVLADEPNRVNLERIIELPFRDFMTEEPVSNEVFGFFLRQFSYDKTPLNARIESEEERPLGILQKISFDAAYGGEQMLAYLFLPIRPKPPLQTVVMFPGSLAIHVSSVGTTDFRRADFILKSGRALMLPIYKGTYQRGDELKSDYPDQSTFYKDHVIMWSKDLARSIDYLETRADIDSSKLAYYGISWGGAMGAIMPAIEKRIKTVVLYVAGLIFQHALPEVDQINYIAGHATDSDAER